MVNLPAPIQGSTQLSLRGPKRQPRTSEVQELWLALRVSLRVLNIRLNRTPSGTGGTEAIDPEIDRLLADCEPEARTFDRLYEARLRLAALMDDVEIQADATRRFPEAKQLGVPSAAALQEEFQEASADGKKRKALYIALLDDMHLRYQRRTLDRRERKQKAKILNMIGAVLVIPAVIMVSLLYYPNRATLVQQYDVVAVVWFGLIGAYLSQMFALHAVMKTIDYDALSTDFNVSAVVFRLMIGAIGALTMYFLIVGQFLDGELFPDWSGGSVVTQSASVGEGTTSLIIRHTTEGPASPAASAKAVGRLSMEFAQLLIWSTIAGFSERLIPDRFAALARVTSEAKR